MTCYGGQDCHKPLKYVLLHSKNHNIQLVLVILESEFDVIFEWMYVYMETVTIIWKGIYALEDNLSSVDKPEMLFYHQNQCFI